MIQQRRWALVALAVMAVGSGMFCGSPSAQDAKEQDSSPAVAAQIGDRTITFQELDELIKSRNAKAYQAYYDARREALDQLISEVVLKQEASSRGMTLDELQADFVKDSPPVTDAEIEAFYNSNQARMGGRTLDQLSDQIRTHLLTTRNKDKAMAYVAELRRKAGVKIMLEPPRMDVKVAANDPSKGPEDAPILLVEYSDFQ